MSKVIGWSIEDDLNWHGLPLRDEPQGWDDMTDEDFAEFEQDHPVTDWAKVNDDPWQTSVLPEDCQLPF